MAATGQVRHANMTTRGNALADQLTSPAMQMVKVPAQAPSIHEFFKSHNPADNMIMRRAPRRSSAEDLLGNKIVMALNYDWEFDPWVGDLFINPASVLCIGGWTTDIVESATPGMVTVESFCYDLPLELAIDYANETATIYAGKEIMRRTSSRVQSGSYYYDTTQVVSVINEDWLRCKAYEDIVGEVWADGTVYIKDGWAFMINETVNQYLSMTATTPRSSEDETYVTNIFRDTYILTPNAVHSYDCNGGHFDLDVYMYQYDDATAVVWNMFGLGYRGVEAKIYADGSMVMPCFQVACQSDVSEYAEAYTQYDWSIAQNYVLLNVDETGNPIDGDIVGSCTATQLAWPRCVLYDLVGMDGEWVFTLSYFPFTNNEINFVGNYEFAFPAAPALRGDANGDGNVDAADISALIDHLLTGHNINKMNADCDNAGGITPADISALIEYLLEGNWSK